MRRSLTRFAASKPSLYLEAGAPTGLTGLHTHPTPRGALLYLYSSTLDKLKAIPETSLYRQSTEAITRHRLNIVSAVEPEGLADYQARVSKTLAEHPEVFNTPQGQTPYKGGQYLQEVKDGRTFVRVKDAAFRDDTLEEWDGEVDTSAELEGVRTSAERAKQALISRPAPPDYAKTVELEPEPPLTALQIEEIENKIGAGLIEEVIQVAEGEYKLVDVMIESKVWEDLEEKPVEGQWTYFKRDTGTPETQRPPQ